VKRVAIDVRARSRLRRSAPEKLDPSADVGVRNVVTAQDVAIGQKRGNFAGKRACAHTLSTEQHVRETRVHGDARNPAPVLRHESRGAQRTQLLEQLTRLSERGGWWRIDPAQLGWILDACRGEIERERRQIRPENLWRCLREKMVLLVLGP
jgi:hypothetical protein